MKIADMIPGNLYVWCGDRKSYHLYMGNRQSIPIYKSKRGRKQNIYDDGEFGNFGKWREATYEERAELL
jgi:hypothetical protein